MRRDRSVDSSRPSVTTSSRPRRSSSVPAGKSMHGAGSTNATKSVNGTAAANTANATNGRATQRVNNSVSPSTETTYTFTDTHMKTYQKQRSNGYESDNTSNRSSTSTSDEFITSLDRCPMNRLEGMVLEEGAFGRRRVEEGGALPADDKDIHENGVKGAASEVSGTKAQNVQKNDVSNGFAQNSSKPDNTPGQNKQQHVFDFDTDFFQEWKAFNDTQTKQPQQQHDKEATSNSPRIVSPSPTKKKIQSSFNHGEDLSAWDNTVEFSPSPRNEGALVKNKNQQQNTLKSTFDDDFFTKGFDSTFPSQDDKDDEFFTNGWTSNLANNETQNNHYDNTSMWDTSSQFFEEKKDDNPLAAAFSSPLIKSNHKKESSSPSTTAPITPEEQGSFGTNTMETSSTNKQEQKVMISFDSYDVWNHPTVSSSSSSRQKVPNVSSPTNGTSHSGSINTKGHHRRVPSNEGSITSQQQLSRSQRRNKGGGSVGSNSSAVDMILESYRQKRLAKQQQQQQQQQQQSGSNTVQNHIPPSGNGLPRNTSSESLSRAIGNLESSISSQNPKDQIAIAASTRSGQQNLPQPQHLNMSPRSSPGRASPQSSTSYNRANSSYQPNLNAAVNEISDRLRVHRKGLNTSNDTSSYNPTSESDQFLLSNLEATIGPCGVAPDMESLSGRSSQYRHGRASPRSHIPRSRGDASVDSRTSRNSFRSYRSNISQSALSQMSKETQSVANDLFRLEAQLAEVARQQEDQPLEETPTEESLGIVYGSATSESSMRSQWNNTIIGAEPVPRPSVVEVLAPPGKLGILLANKAGEKGPTHVSAVRSESVLAGKVHVGDRFVSIDGEDVSGMNSREITSVMARKAEFQRTIVFVPMQMSNRAQDWI